MSLTLFDNKPEPSVLIESLAGFQIELITAQLPGLTPPFRPSEREKEVIEELDCDLGKINGLLSEFDQLNLADGENKFRAIVSELKASLDLLRTKIKQIQ